MPAWPGRVFLIQFFMGWAIFLKKFSNPKMSHE